MSFSIRTIRRGRNISKVGSAGSQRLRRRVDERPPHEQGAGALFRFGWGGGWSRRRFGEDGGVRTDGGFAMVRRETEEFWRHCRFRGSQPRPALRLRLFFLPLWKKEASALFIACGGLLWETDPGMDAGIRACLQCGRKGGGGMTHPCPAGQGYRALTKPTNAKIALIK